MFKKMFLMLGLLASPLSSVAALVDNGAYLTDEVNNIDYLKLSQTDSWNFYDLVSLDALGYFAQGWRLASHSGLYDLSFAERVQINDGTSTSLIVTDDACSVTAPTPCGYVAESDVLWLSAWADGFIYGKFSSAARADSTYSLREANVLLSRPSAVPLPGAGYLFFAALVGLYVKKSKGRN